MAALKTMVAIQGHDDHYLVPLSLGPANATLLDRAVTGGRGPGSGLRADLGLPEAVGGRL
jgi:hypothetical protein